MPEHVVVQGDCLSSIAVHYGFLAQTIWNHPKNAVIKQKRRDPNILFVGDVLFIPDKEIKQESKATDSRHSFKVKKDSCQFNLRLLKNGKPRASKQYELNIDGKSFTGNSDNDGWLRHEIRPDAKLGVLTLIETEEQIQLRFGYLDPIEEVSGVLKRLQNLGCYNGPITGEIEGDSKNALLYFQKQQNLAQTGSIDDATKQALKQAYGS